VLWGIWLDPLAVKPHSLKNIVAFAQKTSVFKNIVAFRKSIFVINNIVGPIHKIGTRGVGGGGKLEG
jgi:hypothetical protein